MDIDYEIDDDNLKKIKGICRGKKNDEDSYEENEEEEKADKGKEGKKRRMKRVILAITKDRGRGHVKTTTRAENSGELQRLNVYDWDY